MLIIKLIVVGALFEWVGFHRFLQNKLYVLIMADQETVLVSVTYYII